MSTFTQKQGTARNGSVERQDGSSWSTSASDFARQDRPLMSSLTDSAAFLAPSAALWLLCAAQIFIASWFLFRLVHGARLAFWFNGVAVDGPFQIFDPLRRIAAGQVGGRDFMFHHGVGIPYLHYPIFAALGGKTLIASELSRQWTSLVLFFISLVTFLWVTFRRAALVWIGGAFAIMTMEALFPGGGLSGNWDLIGLSVISLRSAMPIFAFAALQMRISDGLKAVLTGLCIGLALGLGTEHGIGVTLSLLFVLAVVLGQALFGSAPRQVAVLNLRFALVGLLTAAAAAAVSFISLCGVKGMLGALYYNLVEMPPDLFWFFGGPPEPYLGSWRQLFTDRHVMLCFFPSALALLVLVWTMIKSWKRPLRIGRDWHTLVMAMSFYGVMTGVPLLGMLSRHYVFPLARIMILIGLVLMANVSAPRLSSARLFMFMRRWSPAAAVAFASLCLGASSILAVNTVVQATQVVSHLRSNANSFSPYLDTHWDSFMTKATRLIDAKRKRNDVSLWSTYASLLESHYGIFHPAEDYIIHAAGKMRWRHYVETLEKTNPEFVQTMSSEFDFEEWLQNEHWEFYEDVANNYDPLEKVEHAVIWQRRDGPWRAPTETFSAVPLAPNLQTVTLPEVKDSNAIGVVRIHYRVLNRWSFLPIVGSTPRYLALIEGSPRSYAISFPPYRSEFQFPVQLSASRPVTLRFRTDSLLPGATFAVESIDLKMLNWKESTAAIFARGTRNVSSDEGKR